MATRTPTVLVGGEFQALQAGDWVALLAIGNTLVVDPVNGNDSYATRGQQDRAFQTLGAAKVAASSGDNIVVFPGTYNERDLLKNGVNWYFYPGAIVAYSGSAAGGIWDDSAATGANAAITCRIEGYGKFTNTNSGSGTSGVINLTNASSNVTIDCAYMAASNSSTGTTVVSNHLNGSLVIHVSGTVEHLGDAGTSGSTVVYWENGEEYFEADKISYSASGTASGPITVWANAPGNPTGQMYVRAKLINMLSADSAATTIYASGNTTQRVWIFANQITGTSTSLSIQKGFLYVTANKIIGMIISSGSSSQSTLQGVLYVNAQKLSGIAGLSLINFASKNRSGYFTIGQYDDAAFSAIAAIAITPANPLNVTVHFFGGDISRTTTGDAVAVTGGTVYLHGVSITGVVSGKDLNQSGGTLTVIGCKYNSANTSGTITQGDPGTPASITGLRKGAGVGSLDTAAADGTDYLSPTTGLKYGKALALAIGAAMP